MFLKPFRVKTQNAIKGSDRKKLRNELGKRYKTIPPEQMSELVPNKCEMTIAKIHSHGGQDVLVYCLGKNPIFYDVDGVVFPTVYLLWKFPDLLSGFKTWPQVFPKIQGGADLMLPGVVIKGEITPKSLGEMKKGEVCSVKLLGNRAPMAVGRTAMSTRDMVLDAGMKGKGVIISHCTGDYLWAFGDKSEPPLLEDEDEEFYDEDETQSSDEITEEGLEVIESEIPGHMEENCDPPVVEGEHLGVEAGISAVCLEENKEEDDQGNEGKDQGDDQSTPQEKMDDLLIWCFYCAIKKNITKTDLPILTSNFYRNHMLPCCPKETYLDVKKSGYKKLSKFLAAMKKKGIISLKQQKDVERITGFDKDHPELRGVDVSGVEIAPPAGSKVEKDAANTSFHPPVITEVYLVTANLTQLFKPAGITKGTPMTSMDVRKHLINYAKENELEKENPKGYVILDPILTELLLHKSEYIDSLRYDELTSRCLGKMTLAHNMVIHGQPPQLKKGKLDPIKFNVVTRSGNKKATLVENVEVYGVDPQELAHEVQVGVACSTSVTPLPGKHAGSQLMVQGNQVNYIAQLLIDKYKLQRKWLSGLDKAIKSKKR